MVVLERREWGNFYGYLERVVGGESGAAAAADPWHDLQQRLQRVNDLYDEIETIEKGEIGRINYDLERLRLRTRGLELQGTPDPRELAECVATLAVMAYVVADMEETLPRS